MDLIGKFFMPRWSSVSFYGRLFGRALARDALREKCLFIEGGRNH